MALTPACRPFTNDELHSIPKGTEHAYDNAGAPGNLARELITDRHFRSLVIEVQSVEGMAPTQEALNQLHLFLKKYLKKPRGLRLVVNPSIAPPSRHKAQTGYTLEDVKKIEAQHRKHYTEKGKLAVFVLFLDWQSADDPSTGKMLGQAHQNSSIVIYKDSIRLITQDPAQAQKTSTATLEATVLLHEFGHLLGLVGMDESAPGHEDRAHPRHCNNPNCLMYYSAENASGTSNPLPNHVLTLDKNCELELEKYLKP